MTVSFSSLAAAAVALAVLGSAVAIVFADFQDPEDRPLLAWDDPNVVARGQALYRQQCTECHGTIGRDQILSTSSMGSTPTAPPHDASGHTWRHPDYALVQLTKSGEVAALCRSLDETAMPRFESAMSDRQILDVLSYIKSTWPDEIRAEHDAINRLHRSQNEAVRELLDLQES